MLRGFLINMDQPDYEGLARSTMECLGMPPTDFICLDLSDPKNIPVFSKIIQYELDPQNNKDVDMEMPTLQMIDNHVRRVLPKIVRLGADYSRWIMDKPYEFRKHHMKVFSERISDIVKSYDRSMSKDAAIILSMRAGMTLFEGTTFGKIEPLFGQTPVIAVNKLMTPIRIVDTMSHELEHVGREADGGPGDEIGATLAGCVGVARFGAPANFRRMYENHLFVENGAVRQLCEDVSHGSMEVSRIILQSSYLLGAAAALHAANSGSFATAVKDLYKGAKNVSTNVKLGLGNDSASTFELTRYNLKGALGLWGEIGRLPEYELYNSLMEYIGV